MVYLENINIFKASLDFTINAKFSLDVLVFLLEARIERNSLTTTTKRGSRKVSL